jgi:hypothetical protein
MSVEPEPIPVTSAHILELLDSVEEQLATIRHWAELLITKTEGGQTE